MLPDPGIEELAGWWVSIAPDSHQWQAKSWQAAFAGISPAEPEADFISVLSARHALESTLAPNSDDDVLHGAEYRAIVCSFLVVMALSAAAARWQLERRQRASFALVTTASLALCLQNEVVSLLAAAPIPMAFCESLLWRSLAAALGGWAVCASTGASLLPRELTALLIARGAVGAGGGACLFFALSLGPTTHLLCCFRPAGEASAAGGSSAPPTPARSPRCMPAREATAVYCTAPFWSLLCARLHLGDRITPSAGAALLFSFAGIVLILGADGPAPELNGSAAASAIAPRACGLAALAAALCVGAAGPLIRGLGGRVSPAALVFWLGTAGLPLAPLASLLQTGSLAPTCAFAVDAWGKAWQDGDVRPMVLVGVLLCVALAGQLCLNWAWQLQQSSQITMVHMALLVCGQFLADLALGRRAGATAASDVGLALIVGSVVWVTLLQRPGAEGAASRRASSASAGAAQDGGTDSAADDCRSAAAPSGGMLDEQLLARRSSLEEVELAW